MMALLNWRVWATLAAVTLLAATHWKAFHAGGSALREELAKVKLELAVESARAIEQTSATERELQRNADNLRKTKDAKISALNAELNAALDGLRNRPERPREGDMPTLTGAEASCTGASLWRQDGEFLVREARRADQLRADLTECQAAYSRAYDSLK